MTAIDDLSDHLTSIQVHNYVPRQNRRHTQVHNTKTLKPNKTESQVDAGLRIVNFAHLYRPNSVPCCRETFRDKVLIQS